jgi:hypothetical protein
MYEVLIMPDYKKQHFVPQSYLRRFSPDKGQKRVYVYDKAMKKSHGLLGIRGIANKSYFYDIPPDVIQSLSQNLNKDPHLEEKALQVLEGQFNHVIEVGINVAKGSAADLDQRMWMSLCVAVQLVRTLDYRQQIVGAMERLFEATMDSVLELAKPELASQVRAQAKYDDKTAAQIHAKLMWDPKFISKIAAILYHRIWVIGVNNTGIPLFTSDTPVVIQAHKQKESYTPDPKQGPAFSKAIDLVIESKTPGIEGEGKEVVFPLNPQCALIILENKYFSYLEKNQGKRYLLQPEDVVRLNSLQVVRSNRQLYSVSNDFSLAEKLCSEYPDIGSEDKSRVNIESWRWTCEDR